ncbi:hypothetical protein C4D60_Mb05t05470 [Musa balbisiana]|uniref:Uncharacterized protein n=1 Tax=Musa balbisiana TaxID=52838 RepID=A0A4S8JTW0_MUSBA|nr:hypothetical protein C4D60_Mb05t05470 [Musa balbisiana]
MKLLPRRAHLRHHHDKALLLTKYYKWILWSGLSIYLFFSTSSSSSSSSLFRPLPLRTSLPLKLLPELWRKPSSSPPSPSSPLLRCCS